MVVLVQLTWHTEVTRVHGMQVAIQLLRLQRMHPEAVMLTDLTLDGNLTTLEALAAALQPVSNPRKSHARLALAKPRFGMLAQQLPVRGCRSLWQMQDAVHAQFVEMLQQSDANSAWKVRLSDQNYCLLCATNACDMTDSMLLCSWI